MWPTLGRVGGPYRSHLNSPAREVCPADSFNHSYQGGLMDTHFILCVISQCCLIYFFAQIVEVLAVEGSFIVGACPP